MNAPTSSQCGTIEWSGGRSEVPMVLLVVPYLVLQVYAAIHLRGGWRWISLLPAVPMLAVMAVAINALTQHSNLWGLLPALASPPSLLFVLGVLLVHKFAGVRPWAKWACLVLTILIGAQLVRYLLALVDEGRGHGDPTPWASAGASTAITWGIPLAFMAVSTIGLWWSEQRRQGQVAPTAL